MPLTLAKDLKVTHPLDDVLDYLDNLILAANKDGKKSLGYRVSDNGPHRVCTHLHIRW